MLRKIAQVIAALALLSGVAYVQAEAQTATDRPFHFTAPPAVYSATQPIDAYLYTTYSVAKPFTSVSWVRCGATTGSSGCFGSGQLSAFKRVCAMIDGKPVTTGNTVTHDLFVLDGGFATADPVVVYIYRFTEVISSTYDQTTVSLLTSVDLPLLGGSSAACSMAGNDAYVYAGTNASTNAVSISKVNFSVNTLPGFSPAIPLIKITADDRGYVSVQYGSGTNTGFYLYGPTGESQEDGGGYALIPDTKTAILFP